MISEILNPKRIILDLAASTKEEAIKEVLTLFQFPHADVIENGILQREKLMTTGLGKGFALPRGFVPELSEPVAALGLSKKKIDFNSLDQKPAHIILLLLFPLDFKSYSVYIAAALSLLNQETVRSKIPGFRSAEELLDFIKRKEV